MPPPSNRTCPNCGAPTAYIVGASPDSAPYLCVECVRAWWPSEMSVAARAAWQHATRDFGAATPTIQAAANADRGHS